MVVARWLPPSCNPFNLEILCNPSSLTDSWASHDSFSLTYSQSRNKIHSSYPWNVKGLLNRMTDFHERSIIVRINQCSQITNQTCICYQFTVLKIFCLKTLRDISILLHRFNWRKEFWPATWQYLRVRLSYWLLALYSSFSSPILS